MRSGSSIDVGETGACAVLVDAGKRITVWARKASPRRSISGTTWRPLAIREWRVLTAEHKAIQVHSWRSHSAGIVIREEK